MYDPSVHSQFCIGERYGSPETANYGRGELIETGGWKKLTKGYVDSLEMVPLWLVS